MKWPNGLTTEQQITMISYFLRCQVTPQEIQELLSISRATFYRRLEVLKPRKSVRSKKEQAIMATRELEKIAAYCNRKADKAEK